VELRGAVVVITGASSGFGERTALRFAQAGSAVVLAARRVERLEALAGRIGAHGGTALPERCDVMVHEDIEHLRDVTLETFGRCDVLVNNAGLSGAGPFRDVNTERLEQVIATNLTGLVLCTKAFLPSMLERGRGHVVNVASLAGRFATPGAAVYGATKHGVVAFSEALYHELEGTGVLVTTVNPVFSPTEGFPATGAPRAVVLDPDHVARTIVDVVRRGKAPEISIPRVLAALQIFRVLTPPLYRWGVGVVSRFGVKRLR
jgi:short-subunit dehydrogenase